MPALSFLDGSGGLAYTMFSAVEETRVELFADVAGRRLPVAPTWAASQIPGSAGLFLAGAERFRVGPVTREWRRQLDPLARRVCAMGPYDAVEVTLFVRTVGAVGEGTRYVGRARCRP